MDRAPLSEDVEHEDARIVAPNVNQQHSGDLASLSLSIHKESDRDISETREQADGQSSDSDEDIYTASPAGEDDDHSDSNKTISRREELTIKSELSRSNLIGQKQGPETSGSATVNEGEDDNIDGPVQQNPTDTEAGERPEHESSEQEISEVEEMEEEIEEERNNVENIGPISLEQPEPSVPEASGILGRVRFLIPVMLGLVLAFLLHPHQPETPPQRSSIDILLTQMDNVKSHFPHQRAEVWTRSRIHLLRHLQTAQPTAPVSLILTAGLGAERTLHCLAQGLASAFSVALNSSVLHIDGASKADEDSDQVKLDIDIKLETAFGGDKPVAVIHRFEELPPGSTLIFYRYCDHENAAFKETLLIFTVLLEEEEIPAKIHLNAVEEMVDDHLKKKFLSHGHPVSFDRMDLDKYSGLWSRISHLILPVTTEERIEHGGCSDT